MTDSANAGRSENIEESGQESTYPPPSAKNGNSNGHQQHHVKMASGAAKQEKQSPKINGDDPKKTDKKPSKLHAFIKEQLALPEWVKNNYKQWKSWKVVIRCAIASWVGLVLLMVRPTEQYIGNAAFLMLIVSFIMPPSDPIAPTIEKYIVSTFLIAFTWAFSCIPIRIAWLARSRFQYPSQAAFGAAIGARLAAQGVPAAQISRQVSQTIYNGDYVEAGSSVVLAVFFGVFMALILYFRAWIGPSPYVFGVILSIICATISMLYSPLYPFPLYTIGFIFFKPYIIQIAINLACALLIFPESLHDQFIDKLVGVLRPLQTILREQDDMLGTDPETDDWKKFASHKGLRAKATQALGMLGVTEGLLARNITFQRASGEDLQRLLTSVRVLNARAGGFTYFQDFVERHLSPVPDNASTDNLVLHFPRSRPQSPSNSRPASVRGPDQRKMEKDGAHVGHNADDHGPTMKPSFSDSQYHGRRSHNYLRDLLHPHRSAASSREGLNQISSKEDGHKVVRPVGFIESQAYMMLEDKLLTEGSDIGYMIPMMRTLRSSSAGFVSETDSAIEYIITIMQRLQTRSIRDIVRGKRTNRQEEIDSTAKEIERHRAALARFRNKDRLEIVREFQHLFDPNEEASGNLGLSAPLSHRGLFLAFSHQFALLAYGQVVLSMLEEVAAVEKKRKRVRLYIPPFKRLMHYLKTTEDSVEHTDEDPERIDGMSEKDRSSRRNPDVRPPSRAIHRLGKPLWEIGHRLTKPDVLFGMKAGVFTCLAAFPAFFASTAGFYYGNRGIWVTIMVALTMNRWVADTAFQFVLRVFGTLQGALLGLVVWYIANGNSDTGVWWGMGLTCAVVFPLMQFYRLFYPIIVQGILTMVTAILVIGYSWQDATFPSGANAGWGWDVAWRRFLLVLIGISIAFVVAYIPPKSTQKETLRLLYAATLSSSVQLLFRAINLDVNKTQPISQPPPRFVRTTAALRAKLLKSAQARGVAKFEISLRGEWPAQEYDQLANLQIELVDLIAQFAAVTFSLPGPWTKAILRRTRFSDPDFLGHIASTSSLISNSLRTGSPLPYYHAPLLQAFLNKRYRFAITLPEDHDRDLPVEVNAETLASIEYLKFSCGISMAYGIVNRLDRIMHTVKKLVGEENFIQGLGTMQKNESEEELLASEESNRLGDEKS